MPEEGLELTKVRNAFILHFLERLPKRYIVEALVKAQFDVTLDIVKLDKGKLIKELFGFLKHSHPGDEWQAALNTKRVLLKSKKKGFEAEVAWG